MRVRGRSVINAAGPWVEPVRVLESADAAPLLHLSKGVHVVVPASRLPVNNMLILNTRDRRLASDIALDIREAGRAKHDAKGVAPFRCRGAGVRTRLQSSFLRSAPCMARRYRSSTIVC